MQFNLLPNMEFVFHNMYVLYLQKIYLCNEMVLMVASVCACTDTDRAVCSWKSF